MPLFRDTPIRRKLMTMILVTSGVVLLLTCVTFVGYELVSYRRAAIRQLATLAEIMAAQSTGAVAFDNQHDATEILSALKADRHIVAACLYDSQGRILARYPDNQPDRFFPSTPLPDGFQFVPGRLIAFTPVVQVAGSERFGTLYISSDLEATYERLRLYAGIAVVAGLLASVVAYVLSQMLQRQISLPISALVETARAVSDRRDYSVRASKQGQDELGVLTDAFNHMLARIQEQNAELEQRVRERTAELESANSELEAFCFTAAHDLRTPLRAITGFADVLLDDRANIVPDDRQRYIRMIRQGSGQMGDLIHALLAFSRLGRQELTRTTIDLTQLCRDVCKDLADEFAPDRVQLRIDPMPPAYGDAALLRAVFANLLSNAFKYTRSRTTAVIEVSSSLNEAGVPTYFIRDNGVGFSMQDAGKLFGVFQRLHHAHEFEGTGVGLATVRRIVDRHGGRIWAEATPDQGATFYFTLAAK